MKRTFLFVLAVGLALFLAACQTGQLAGPSATPGASKPTVIIVTPPSGATVKSGEAVQVQSTNSDPGGIVLVELIVDGTTVQNSPTPNGQPQTQFSVIQTWTPTTPGTHTVTVKATNARLTTAEASINVTVSQQVAVATATLVVNPTAAIPTAAPLNPTATGAPQPTRVPATNVPATCTLASTFISDVTIPDGTVMAPGGHFVKTWAIQNSGTCTWGGGYTAVLVGGETYGAGSPQAVPPAVPGAVVQISIDMVAPAGPGGHSSVWQLQASNGVVFGTKFDAVITIPGAPTPVPPTPVPPTRVPPPVGCQGVPVLSSFFASPQTVAPGQVTTLSWGPVQNASAVYLTTPSGTQGVGTPGSIQVQPSQTTTYTLTAYCGSNPIQVQATVNVQGGGGGCQGLPVFNGFYASPQTIAAGQQATLNWGLVQNASAVYLQLPDRSEGVASPGSRTVKPGSTTTYTLVAYCGSRQTSVQTTVVVQGACSGNPQFNGFSASPSTIQKGQSTRLSWGIVTNATAVVLQTPDGNSGVASPGSLVVSPKRTTTYTLIAYCYNRSQQLSVTVTVNNPAPPTPTPAPTETTQIRSIQQVRPKKGVWDLTVNYFWSGAGGPASMRAFGLNAQGDVATSVSSRSILAGFIKNVTLTVESLKEGKPTKWNVCIVGRGNIELLCRTVPDTTQP